MRLNSTGRPFHWVRCSTLYYWHIRCRWAVHPNSLRVQHHIQGQSRKTVVTGGKFFRPPYGRGGPALPTGQIRGDRGALDDPATGRRGADRDPDPSAKRNLLAIEVPRLGSFIASGNWDAKEIGLDAFPPEDRPPVVIPFFTFRLMVGMGLIMLAVSWFGSWLRWRGKLEATRWFLWVALLSFPTGFVAVLCGWFTAEVGLSPG